jgi:hypothetical protein
MRLHPKPRRRVGAAAVIEEHRAEGADEGLVSHPDGWYWVAPDGHQQFGPFASAEEARADRDRDENADPAAYGEADDLDADIGVEGRVASHLDSSEG